MGERGPAPFPTALKLLHGEKRPSRVNYEEADPRDLLPEAPSWLGEYAREEWDRVAPDIERMGMAKRVDSSALAAYCLAVARLRKANEVIERSAILLVDPIRKNPAVGMARDASHELVRWAREFGFTPSARSAIHKPKEPDQSSASRILG